MTGKARLPVFALAAMLSACGPKAVGPPETERTATRHPVALAESAEPILEPGDIVCRYRGGMWSETFRNLSRRERRFSHAGVVVAESGRMWVAHAEADDVSGAGGVRKELFREFAGKARDFAVYRVARPAAERRRIAEKALTFVGRPFDRSFDLATEGAVYCTELVWRCVNGATGEEIIGTTAAAGRRIVTLDDCHAAPGMGVVFDGRKRGL